MKNPLLERYGHENLARRTGAANLFWVTSFMILAGISNLILSLVAPGVVGNDPVILGLLLGFSVLSLVAMLFLVLGKFSTSAWITFGTLLIITVGVSLFSRSGVLEADEFQATVLFFLGLIVLTSIGLGSRSVIPWVLAGAGVLAWIYLGPPVIRENLTFERWNAEFNPFVIVVLYIIGSVAGSLVVIQNRKNLKVMQFHQEIIESTNQMLEQTVEDRTAALRTILDNSGQGFFTFGSDFTVEPEFSAGCRTFFGDEIAGRHVTELLFPRAGENQADFVQGLTLYFAGRSKAAVIFDLLEKEVFLNGHFVELEYREVAAGKILVVMTDRTLDRHVSDRNRADEARRSLVLKALAHKHFFAGLLEDAETLFNRLLELEGRDLEAEEYTTLITQVHTLKGNLGFFGFANTQEVAHDFEFAIQDAQVLGEELDLRDLSLDLKKAYFGELNTIVDALGNDWLKEAGGIVVPRPVFEKLSRYVSQKYSTDTQLVDVLEHFRKLPLKDLFSRFPFIAQATAEKLGKRISPMTILGGDLRVIPDRVAPLVAACVHIVNNMVDHGIELSYVRETLGKPPEGRLVLNLVRETKSVVIQFIDDGQGLDLPAIEARARTLGLLAPESKPSAWELQQLLFESGFSTKEEATLVSGRGVGLAAVRDEALKLGGRVEVQSKSGAGTTFEIILPIGVFANRRKVS